MNTNQIARIASLVGEPARTAMLMALMDGRALTANELAQAGNITAATASRHLALCAWSPGRAMRRCVLHEPVTTTSPAGSVWP